MSIPLIQKAEKDDINTSIIAIKRQIERINMLLGLSNSEEIDTSEFVKKSDIVDAVEADNLNPVTSNAVAEYTVDRIEVNESRPASSNAVAGAIDNLQQFLRRTIYDLSGPFIGDNQTIDITLASGYTYIFFNTHVYNIEMILFSTYNGTLIQTKVLTGGSTSITAIGSGVYRFSNAGNCRGFIFKIGDTYGT